jgi:hypothetical protein
MAVDVRTGEGAGGGTRMTLWNCGEPPGFGRVAAGVMASAMTRTNREGPARSKAIMEASSAVGPPR